MEVNGVPIFYNGESLLFGGELIIVWEVNFYPKPIPHPAMLYRVRIWLSAISFCFYKFDTLGTVPEQNCAATCGSVNFRNKIYAIFNVF